MKLASAALILLSGVDALECGGGATRNLATRVTDIGSPPCDYYFNPDTVLTASMGKYPGYTGSLTPAATVDVKFDRPPNLHFEAAVTGADVACETCDAGIRSGRSCLVSSGDPYFAEEMADPWTSEGGATYAGTGMAIGSFPVGSGYGYWDNVGHAVVMHDQDGSRIGCGILEEASDAEEPETKLTAQMGIYPGYEGEYEPFGAVEAEFSLPPSYAIALNLEGVPEDCTGCAAQIHTGKTCNNPLQPLTAMDASPFESTGLGYASSGGSKSEFVVNSGYGYDQNLGHAAVLHDQDGSRIACGILEAADDGTLSADLSSYPGYNGPLDPSGTASVSFNDDGSLTFALDVMGVRGSCVGCGAHIHSGTTCDNASLVGGHYWNLELTADDPWVPPVTVYNGVGVTHSEIYAYTGVGMAQSEGQTLIISDVNGNYIGCGVLQAVEDEDLMMTATISAVPNSDSLYNPSGTATVTFSSQPSMDVTFSVAGINEACEGCGLHIHAGITCDDASKVGGHYWDSQFSSYDMWSVAAGTTYNGSNAGHADFYTSNGYTAEQNVGKVVIMKDSAGVDAACGELQMTSDGSLVAQMGPALGYETDVTIEGEVKVTVSPAPSFSMTMSGSGLEGACETCGIHIHAGVTCDDATKVGGHYWDEDVFEEDPWTPAFDAVWTSGANGVGQAAFPLNNGYSAEENIGHAVVMHQSDGTRFACGVLESAAVSLKTVSAIVLAVGSSFAMFF